MPLFVALTDIAIYFRRNTKENGFSSVPKEGPKIKRRKLI